MLLPYMQILHGQCDRGTCARVLSKKVGEVAERVGRSWLWACRSLLLQYGFWRLVLDEAQLVASSSSVAALMTSALWRRHAWVVTGTPITSRVEEIQARHPVCRYSHITWQVLLQLFNPQHLSAVGAANGASRMLQGAASMSCCAE